MRIALVLALLLGAAQEEGSLAERYHAFAAAGDRAGLVAAWRAEPGRVLATIDADLEGSLERIERARAEGTTPDGEAVEELRGRARFGADCADEAFGTRIFGDYAAAFASWNEAEQASFRAGQEAFGRARAALKAGDHAAALDAARECEERAGPLGDWWGRAMGADARAAAHAGRGEDAEAAAAYQAAALVYHELCLLGSEQRSLIGLADVLERSGAKARAARAVERALALAETLGDAEGAQSLRARLERVR